MRALVTASVLLTLYFCDHSHSAECKSLLKYLISYPSLEEMAETSGRSLEQVESDYKIQQEKTGKRVLNTALGLATIGYGATIYLRRMWGLHGPLLDHYSNLVQTGYVTYVLSQLAHQYIGPHFKSAVPFTHPVTFGAGVGLNFLLESKDAQFFGRPFDWADTYYGIAGSALGIGVGNWQDRWVRYRLMRRYRREDGSE